MSYQGRGGTAILVFAGIGIGVLCGALIGLIASRRTMPERSSNVADTASDLKARAEQVLSELSASVAAMEQRDSIKMSESGAQAQVSKVWHNGAGEAIG